MRNRKGTLLLSSAFAFCLGVTPVFAEPGPAGGPNASFSISSIESKDTQMAVSGDTGVASTGRENDYAGKTWVALKNNDTGETAVADTSYVDNPVGERFLIAVTDESVDISWDRVPDVDLYRIYRDDELIAETSTLEFSDHAAAASAATSYRVEAVGNHFDSGTTWGALLDPSVLDNGSPSTDESAIELAKIMSSAQPDISVQHRTFIPEATVNAPAVGCEYGSGYKFDGNNRGFVNGPSLSSKTSVGAHTTFGIGHPSSSFYWRSTETTVLDSAGNVVDTRESSFEGDPIRELGGTETDVDLRFTIRSANPFCTNTPVVPFIRADFTLNVTAGGTYHIISGNH